MRNIRKALSLFIFAASLCLLFGCQIIINAATGEKTPAPASETPPEGTNDRALTLYPWDGSLSAVAEYIESETGIRAEIEPFDGNGMERDNIIKARIASGNVPDIFEYNSGALLHALNPSENLEDLSGEAFTEFYVEEYKQAVTINKQVFGIPRGSSWTGGWWYNKGIYEELGLEIPETWEVLMENCEIIQAAGITPIAAAYQAEWVPQLIFLYDAYNLLQAEPDFPQDYTLNRVKFSTTPAALHSFEKLAQAGRYINEDYMSTTTSNAVEMLIAGEAAHYPGASHTIGYVQRFSPDLLDQLGFFAQPGDNPQDSGLTVWLPSSLYIYKGSDNIALAKEWAACFLTQESHDIMSENHPPSGSYMMKNITYSGRAPGLLDQLAIYFEEGRTALALEFLMPLKAPNCTQICFDVATGALDPLSGAITYDSDVEKQAIQLDLPGW